MTICKLVVRATCRLFPRKTSRAEFGSRLGPVAFAVTLLLAAGCTNDSSSSQRNASDSTDAPSTSTSVQGAETTVPGDPEDGGAEAVCDLLSDAEVSASLAAGPVTHDAAATSDPRSCTWLDGSDTPVFALSFAPPSGLSASEDSSPLAEPCEPGSYIGAPEPGSEDTVRAVCFADGLALLLLIHNGPEARVSEIAGLVVDRLDMLDRRRLGLPISPSEDEDAITTTTAAPAEPDAPPECVEAWRADEAAPSGCEAYPEAYKRVRDEQSGGE